MFKILRNKFEMFGVFSAISVPFIIHFIIVIPLTYINQLNALEFLGLNFSVAMTINLVSSVLHCIYDTWIGILLGHNVDLKKMGSWAVVTGATDGIGLAYCRELGKRKINLVLISRSLDKLEKCSNLLESEYGIYTKIIQMDFTSGERGIYDKIDSLLEGLEIGTLINNVGMSYSRPTIFHELPNSKDFIHDMININALAVTMMTRAVLPGMLQRRKGVIINIGSLVSCNIVPWYTVYGASKAYMDKFTEELAIEYKDMGIIIQYQLPGYVATKMSKISKASWTTPTAEEYAKAGINSIGLQGRTAVWVPHRFLVYVLSICKQLVPNTFEIVSRALLKSFWLFAKKRELNKLNVVYTHKSV